MLKIGHEVVRPGKNVGDASVTIPVPEELETVPGIPKIQREVDWYAREYPVETMNITERASRDWPTPSATSTSKCGKSARNTTSSTAPSSWAPASPATWNPPPNLPAKMSAS